MTAVVLAVALGACSPRTPAPDPVRAVRTVVVSADSAGATREFAAEVRARTESRLGFRVGGKMTKRQAEVGQRVQAGQVLAQLDPSDLRLGELAAQAGVQSAKVNLDQAAADFKRYKDLRDQGFISAIELDRRQATLQAAQAQFEQARAQAGVQVNQAGYAALVAPAAGVVTAIEAEPGAVLTSGTTVLRLALDGPRDAVFAVPEDGADALRALVGRAGALAVRPWGAAATPAAALPATVREVAAVADPATRTFLVKADLGSAAVQLGQTVTVLLQAPPRAGVNKLPLSAVLQQQGQTAVWVVDRATMTVKLQPVVVGGADGNSVVIASGLTPGQTVVTAGVHVLSPGQKVSFFEAPPVAAAASVASR
jgi:RND family efflux transporter MFP subunit